MAKATRAITSDKAVAKNWRGLAAASTGIALTGLGAFLLLSFATGDVGLDPAAAATQCWTGLLGAWAAFGGIYTLGRAPAIILSVLVMLWGLHVAKAMRVLTTWPQVVGGVVIILAASLGNCAFADSYDIHSGGLLAVYLSPPALLYFGRWGLLLAAAGVLVLGILLAFGEAAVATVHRTVFLARDFLLGTVGVGARLVELIRLLLSPRLAVAGAATSDKGRGKTRSRPETPAGASGVTGKDTETVIPDTPAPSAVVDAPPPVAEAEPSGDRPAEATKRFARDWKPREKFCSRYLATDEETPSPAEPEWPLAAPRLVVEEPANRTADDSCGDANDDEEPTPNTADIVMEVDAEAEESGVVVEPAAPTLIGSGPLEPVLPEPALLEPTRPAVAAGGGPFRTRPAVPPAPIEPREPLRPGAYGSESPAGTATIDAATNGLEGYQLPPLSLLDPPEPPVVEDRGLIEAKARILEQTLGEFKIEGRVVHIERGPRVTMYEISLAPGIRLNKVTSLADNIAMQLQAESVRIIAPIPGKNTIGIEIPNTAKELVSLREIVGVVNREKRKQALPICLGKDVSGMALVADLARMPHLLIAGATGSGKSVCINSIILSIMMCCRPDETQLIMVDPKVVELSRFKDIPHLMSPVITDMKRAVSVLEWICQKMDERYEQMSQVSVNNIAKFNALGEDGIRTRLDAFASLEEIEAFPKKMPYMVVIIDELADLMMVAGKEVEQHITRLAAKSRAVGIHLILATQRPSVDVITGLIKANMPCRIAFQVASRVDSRTILDGNGAETLLGQGDMLYLPPGVGKLTRAQG
ncbi:MAG: hypothetical protein LIP77_00865, partial [Planctomycetes bacterium]|nr:hypothetical protein [Planctomycetota bacterium]